MSACTHAEVECAVAVVNPGGKQFTARRCGQCRKYLNTAPTSDDVVRPGQPAPSIEIVGLWGLCE